MYVHMYTAHVRNCINFFRFTYSILGWLLAADHHSAQWLPAVDSWECESGTLSTMYCLSQHTNRPREQNEEFNSCHFYTCKPCQPEVVKMCVWLRNSITFRSISLFAIQVPACANSCWTVSSAETATHHTPEAVATPQDEDSRVYTIIWHCCQWGNKRRSQPNDVITWMLKLDWETSRRFFSADLLAAADGGTEQKSKEYALAPTDDQALSLSTPSVCCTFCDWVHTCMCTFNSHTFTL